MKMPIALSLLSVLSLTANAETPYVTQRPSQKSNQVRKRSYASVKSEAVVKKEEPKEETSDKSVEFSAGYVSSNLKMFGDKIKATGFGARLGKTFNLAPQIKTTTSLIGSSLTYKPKTDDLEEGAKGDLTGFDIGLSQRLSYDIEGAGFILRPFVEAAFSRGKMTIKYHDSEESYKATPNYNRYGGAAGMQLVFENGITPFVMYDISKVKLDSKMHMDASTIEDGSVSGDVATANRDGTAKTLMVGIGFLF